MKRLIMKRLVFLILILILTISYVNSLYAMEGQPYLYPQEGQPYLYPQEGQPYLYPQEGQPYPQQQQGWSEYYFLLYDHYGGRYYMRFQTDGYNLYGFREADVHSPEMIGAFCIGLLEYVGTEDGNYFYQCHPFVR